MDFPINLYYESSPKEIQTLDFCRGEDDFRKVYLTNDGTNKLAIKHTSNTFTDKEHIEGWFRLAEAYRNLGIYCPAPVFNRNGDLIHSYLENGREYDVYAEEFAKFPTAESIGKDHFSLPGGEPVFQKGMMRSLGRVADAKLDVVSFHSCYCLLEPYAPPDTTDETTECALLFLDFLRKELPEFSDEADDLWKIFKYNQIALAEKYHLLPTSCFQAVLNLSNILLDEKFDFAGLIDFNLCGKEPSLNYLVRESLWWDDDRLSDEDGNPLYCYDESLARLRTECLLKNISYIQEEYTFSPLEREVFPPLLRYIDSFWWGDIRELKRIKEDPEKVHLLLQYLRHQMTRNDIEIP